MAKFTILSLDGGGVAGIVQLAFLNELENRYPEWWHSIDLFAGTSIGGITALALAQRQDVSALYEEFKCRSARIFGKRRNIFRRLFRAKYKNSALINEISEILSGNISELDKYVLVPSFDTNCAGRWKPKFFSNLRSDDKDFSCQYVALATSAAPVYFPMYSKYVDGGLVCNNPSVAAIAASIKELKVPLSDIHMISLGTGKSTNHISKTFSDWGYMQWAGRIIDMILGGSVSVADYQAKQLLGDRYYRFNLVYDQDVNLDDHNMIDTMNISAKFRMLDDGFRWASRFFE